MQPLHWVKAALRGELSSAARLILLLVTVGLSLGTAFLNVEFPLFRLSVLAFIYVIAIDALAGVVWGVFGAVTTAFIFSWAEWATNNMGQGIFAVTNFFSRLMAFLILVGLVEVIRTQARALSENEQKSHESELSRLKDQLAETGARFQAVSESIPFGVWHCNVEGRVVYVSPSFLDMLGMTLAEVRNGGWFGRVVIEDADRIREAWKNRDTWSDLWEDEYRIRGVDDKLYAILCRGRVVRNETGQRIGWTGVNFDLTERTKARDQLRFLVDAGRILSLSLNPSTILERIAHLVVPRFADWCAIDIVGDDGELRTTIVQHSDPEKLELVRELRGYSRDDDQSRGTLKVLRTGVSEHYEVITDELLQQATGGVRGERYLELLRQLGIRSAMIVPLQARGQVIGTMTFVQAVSGRLFSQDDVRFAEILAARAALAYDNARSYAKEQRVADTFQRASLPTSLPRLPGIRLHATYLPGAKESEIGGDWYDAFSLPSGDLAISVGDVAGKGLRAAVSMASARQAIRGAALEGSAPGEVLRRVNQRLTYEGGGMITALFGILDPHSLLFTFAVAGHPSPLLGRPNGNVEKVVNKGLPLGLLSDQSYDEVTVHLEPGSLLVLYTDGLIEFNRNIVEGEDTLLHAVSGEMKVQTPDPSSAIVRRVILGAPNDDVAVLTISISPSPLNALDLVMSSNPANARVIRQSLRRFAVAAGLNQTRTTDFLVACGEAISNVIEHAYGLAEGPLIVSAIREDDELVIRVSDHGSWRESRQEGSGRGLPLMRALMHKVEVESDEKGTTVYLRMSLEEHPNDRSGELSNTEC